MVLVGTCLPMQEMKEIQVQTLGLEYSLEEEMATPSSTPARKNSMDRGAWQATVHGVAKNQDTAEHLSAAAYDWLKTHKQNMIS